MIAILAVVLLIPGWHALTNWGGHLGSGSQAAATHTVKDCSGDPITLTLVASLEKAQLIKELAVDYMTGGGDPDPEAPTLTLTRTAPNTFRLDFTGTLQSTPSLNTPITWSTAATTSPHTVTASEPMRFYRAVR